MRDHPVEHRYEEGRLVVEPLDRQVAQVVEEDELLGGAAQAVGEDAEQLHEEPHGHQRLRGEPPVQVLTPEDEQRGVRVSHRAGRARDALDEGHLAEDVARGQEGQLGEPPGLDALLDPHLALGEQEHRVADAAVLEHEASGRHRPHGEDARQLLELRLRQMPEHRQRPEPVNPLPGGRVHPDLLAASPPAQ